MLPQHMLDDLVEKVDQHFGVDDIRLHRVALKLLDGGYPWEEIRPLLTSVFSAGWDAGWDAKS